jgi:hypothetical protein
VGEVIGNVWDEPRPAGGHWRTYPRCAINAVSGRQVALQSHTQRVIKQLERNKGGRSGFHSHGHQVGVALAVVLLLAAANLGFVALSWRQDRWAAWLFMPYAAWVAFAAMLNASILALN